MLKVDITKIVRWGRGRGAKIRFTIPKVFKTLLTPTHGCIQTSFLFTSPASPSVTASVKCISSSSEQNLSNICVVNLSRCLVLLSKGGITLTGPTHYEN